MNCRLITVLLGLGLSSVGTLAFAQTLPPTLRTTSAIAAGEQTSIRQFIDGQVANLLSDDAAKQSEARNALIDVITRDPAPSAAFVSAYTQALNDALLRLPADASVNARMNAAIIAAKVTTQTQSLGLRPAIEKFIADPADSVVLWGVKGYRPLIMVQLRTQPAQAADLLKPLLPAIKDDLRASITEAAYEALRLNLLNDRTAVTANMIKVVIPTMQDLLEARIALYQTGIPDQPAVDTLATNFLVDGSVAPQYTPEQRARTIQLIVELMGAGSSRAATLNNRDEKDSIIQALKLVARAITVVAEKPAVQSAASPIARMDASMDGEMIKKLCNDLINVAVKELGATPPRMSLGVMAPGR